MFEGCLGSGLKVLILGVGSPFDGLYGDRWGCTCMYMYTVCIEIFGEMWGFLPGEP